MNRFHIVIANHKRISSFVNNIEKLHGFDPQCDSILIFDSTPQDKIKSELAVAQKLISDDLIWGKNVHWIRHRDWGFNQGGIINYFQCLHGGLINPPQFCFLMQDHFLDLENNVKEDTVPHETVLDLNQIYHFFDEDPTIGCIFSARYGVRIVTSNPIISKSKPFFGDSEELFPGSVRRSFLIDGSNFVTKPSYYLNWFKKHPRLLTKGDGSYGFASVWEDRICRILYDQGMTWFDIGRNIKFKSVEDVDQIEGELGHKISKLWYDHRIWYFFYGRDLIKYPPKPITLYLRYIKNNWRKMVFYSRDPGIEFLQPDL